MTMKFRFTMAFVLIVSALAVPVMGSAQDNDTDNNDYFEIATPEFFNVWERTDYPVQQLEVARTWIWSPGAHTEAFYEDYVEGEDGERLVQYFDKSRMEMPTEGLADTEDVDSPWYITQGRLAYELISGQLQIGDDAFESHAPSQRSAAGDPADVTAPTYAVMGDQMGLSAGPNDDVIDAHIDRQGAITYEHENLAAYGVYNAEWDTVTEQNIASVFWEFMNSESIVYENEQFVEADLFLNPYYAVGRPMTEAFWADVMVDGVVQDVLIQCFERRCLTFTPGNPEGWEVESGNIGQHYYNWRYSEIDREDPLVPETGSFTFQGESEASIAVGTTATLTAQVAADQETLQGIDISFAITEGEDVVTLDTATGVTGEDGTADVVVTGVAEGTAQIDAYAGDVHLGTVTVTVFTDDENGDAVTPDAGTFTVNEGSTADIAVGETAVATAIVTFEGVAVGNVPIYIEVEDVEGHGAYIELDELTGVSDADGMVAFTITGVLEGTTTLTAFADLSATGEFDANVDLDLGEITVTVTGA
jgi:hypothetical protein